MKLTTNFQLQEFVHPVIFEQIGVRCLDFLHPDLPRTVQAIRDEIDEAVIVNDWLWGGAYKDSGLRLPRGSVGADLSAHRFGCAVDLKFHSRSTDGVLARILDYPELFPAITRVENPNATRGQYKDWLHCEFGLRRNNAIIIFDS